MREVLPPGWTIGIALFLYLVLEAWYFWWRWWVGYPDTGGEVLEVRNALVGIMCAGYGAYRVLFFHPVFRPAYRQWLESTPWTSQKPLPLGPVHLVAQDLVVLAVALLMLHDCPHRFVLVPSALLGSYLCALCLSLWLLDVWKVAYALAFGLGLVIRLGNYPAVSVCLLAAFYPLAYLGLHRSLVHFPWQIPKWCEHLVTDFKASQIGVATRRLGWPYDQLSFHLPDRLILRKHGVLASLLVGWYQYATVSVVSEFERAGLLGMSFLALLVACVFGRTAEYCAVHRPPIGFWGRILTFRWIIPGYDQALVAPLCSLFATAACVAACVLGLPGEIAIPIASSLVLLISLNMGPSLRHWRLTGNHRIVPGARNKSLFQQL
jgi:hypothetical protein